MSDTQARAARLVVDLLVERGANDRLIALVTKNFSNKKNSVAVAPAGAAGAPSRDDYIAALLLFGDAMRHLSGRLLDKEDARFLAKLGVPLTLRGRLGLVAKVTGILRRSYLLGQVDRAGAYLEKRKKEKSHG